MSFRSVVAAPKRKSGTRGIGCAFGKHGLMISCGAASIDETGLRLGERYGLLLGEGEDAGRARIVRADQHGGRMLSRMGSGGGARIQFGLIPEFGAAVRTCERVLWKRIDKDTLEITLPTWAAKPAAPLISPKFKESTIAPKAKSDRRTVKGLLINLEVEEESVTFGDKVMDVTASEARLVLALANGAPNAVARSFLLQRVYPGHRRDDGDVTLDRDARGLAKALEAIGLKLNTVKGVGFSIGGLV